jgi:hypothetical protein
MTQKRILLIVGGGIAAYKVLDLCRLARRKGLAVRAIMTKAAGEFVTPLSLGSVTGDKVYGELFSLTDEAEMGHIELSRDADLVVVAPATADLLAKMAHGLANDLATTALLATDKKVLVAPAMNLRMWAHPATRRNVAQLKADGQSLPIFWLPSKPYWRAIRPFRCPNGPGPMLTIQVRARSPASTCSSPPAPPMSRLTPCATLPTARPANRAMPSRRLRQQPERR